MNVPIAALLERKGSVIYSIASTVSIADAVSEMNRHRVGAIVVLDDGLLAGIFTERDVLRRVVGAAIDPKTTAVAEVMTRNVITVSPESTVEEVATMFTEKRGRHLPVLVEGRMVGLISIGDISRWVADVYRTEAEHLRNYIAGGSPA